MFKPQITEMRSGLERPMYVYPRDYVFLPRSIAMKNRITALTSILSVAVFCLGFAQASIAGEFDGTWRLKDSSGKPFEATLNTDGTATGTHNDTMKQGTWKEDNGAAVIQWNTGWTTRIAKKGHHYVKTAFKPGVSLTDKPTNTSSAKKMK
jgi:hypothetical protein